MRPRSYSILLAALTFASLQNSLGVSIMVAAEPATAIGLFDQHHDVGSVKHAGSATFDSKSSTYDVAGGGQNMWGAVDALHFVYKQVSGDVSLAAEISFENTKGDPHKKGILMIRQSLDANSAYADAALHADGLTSLQYRSDAGDRTYEIQCNSKSPKRLKIEKRGSYVSMSIVGDSGDFIPAGGSFRLEMKEPFFVGIGVCAHNDEALERARFANVELLNPSAGFPDSAKLYSVLETVPIASKDRRAIYVTEDHIEAPNWSRDDKSLIVNGRGKLYRIPVAGGTPEIIDTGFANRCNNDHGLSPDGSQIVISDQSQGDRKSLIYLLPIAGGTPSKVTPVGPSYWHGWSPDGKTLAYCAERNGEYDIYTVPVSGGTERRLTTAQGLDDGPDYSPDGQWIYFNSFRTGNHQIWKMKADGSEQERVTNDEFNNWFPHPSPDGKWLVFLTYEKDVTGHPANKDVTIRLMALTGDQREPQILAKLYGGQGTINVPSWSPDSRRVAFVSYRRAP